MNLLSHLLEADAAKPRLTVYDEATDSRLDFSAVTLDNWAAKVGNMLIEEFDLDEDSRIAIDLPVSWQAVTIALGRLLHTSISHSAPLTILTCCFAPQIVWMQALPEILHW